MDGKSRKEEEEKLLKIGIAGANSESVSRGGAAVKEFLVGYSGVDNETGKHLTKGLKDISKSKINPKYEEQNYKQQAGFSAENLEVSKTNAENILNGKKERKIRTDDLGRTNDQFEDHVLLDEHGNVIHGSGTQMKIVGSSPQETADKLLSKKYDKYVENNTPIEVASDQYEPVKKELEQRIEKLDEQIKEQKARGNHEEVKKLEERKNRAEASKKQLRKSKVSMKEAMEARKNPRLATAKNIVKTSHVVAVEAAKTGALIGGASSLVQNIYLVAKGDKEISEAAGDVITTTAKSGLVGYGTTFTASALKGVMQNAKSGTIRSLSKTSLPGMIVTTGLTIKNSLLKYARGEIDGVEFLQSLGQDGAGMLSSAMFATIGQSLIPIPVVGGLIGSMVGYMISSAAYGVLLSSLQEAKLAREERIRVERECEEHIRMIREYRSEMQRLMESYLTEHQELFQSAFSEMKEAFEIGDIDGFISGTNLITEKLGKKALFQNMKEFEELMFSEETIKF